MRVCAHVIRYMYMSGIQGHMYVCMWKPEDTLRYCPLGAMYFSVLRQSLSLTWRSLIKLGWLTIKHNTLAHLYSPVLDYISYHYTLFKM